MEGAHSLLDPLLLFLPGGNVNGNRLLLCRLKVKIYGLLHPELYETARGLLEMQKDPLSVAALVSWKLKDPVEDKGKSQKPSIASKSQKLWEYRRTGAWDLRRPGQSPSRRNCK